MSDSQSNFEFVYVPEEISQPLESWAQRYTETNAVQCLFDRIKAHFSGHKREKSAQQLSAHRAQLLAQVPEDQRHQLSDSLLEMATDLNMVESIALLANATDNGFIGVNLYCADDASFYGAPRNLRASEIASCCGKPLEVKGDAFLARVMDNGDDFQRLDLNVAEVSSSAPWVRQAYAQNERKRAAEAPESTLRRMQEQANARALSPPPPPPPVACSPSEQAKIKGNAAFQLGKYGEALEQYQAACQADGNSTAAFNNRAMTYLKLGQWDRAVADCDLVISKEPTNAKALLRRASARKNLRLLDGALQDYKRVLAVQPHNKEAASWITKLQPPAGSSDSPAMEESTAAAAF